MPGRVHIAIFVVACLLGLAFASVSTYDFAQHLDRQVHDLHCSFIPGQRTETTGGEAAGCQVTLMSPYSSVLRATFWGGIPISLPAMAVFAFLAFRGIDLFGRTGAARRRAAGLLFAASSIPVLASAVMGAIAMVELEAACKLCIGIYGSSLVALLSAGLGYASIRKAHIQDQAHDQGQSPGEIDPADRETGPIVLVGLAQLAGFVAVPVAVYVMMMPDYSRYVGTCGKLADTADPGGVMVSLDRNDAAPVAIEVFDPLCPSCRAFDRRLAAAGLDKKMHRKAVLFPLDNTCNWMVEEAMHPGACTISEAILCADENPQGPGVDAVITWAFEQQERIRTAAKDDPEAARRMVVERFGELGACIGSAPAQQRLNKSLRWAVAHSIPVLTPQLFVDGTKLCPEDTDLGLEYSLTGLLQRRGGGER